MRMFLLLLICASLFAYDSLLLRAQASMFPKIILLDKNIKSKMIDDVVSLAVVYEKNEFKQAKIFKDMIEKNYNNKLGKYKLSVNLINIKKFSDSDNSSSYYFFNTNGIDKKRVIEHAVKRKRICFSYDYKNFKDNTLISLFLKEKTYIYINKSVIGEYNIKFIPTFYKIAKVI